LVEAAAAGCLTWGAIEPLDLSPCSTTSRRRWALRCSQPAEGIQNRISPRCARIALQRAPPPRCAEPARISRTSRQPAAASRGSSRRLDQACRTSGNAMASESCPPAAAKERQALEWPPCGAQPGTESPCEPGRPCANGPCAKIDDRVRPTGPAGPPAKQKGRSELPKLLWLRRHGQQVDLNSRHRAVEQQRQVGPRQLESLRKHRSRAALALRQRGSSMTAALSRPRASRRAATCQPSAGWRRQLSSRILASAEK